MSCYCYSHLMDEETEARRTTHVSNLLGHLQLAQQDRFQRGETVRRRGREAGVSPNWLSPWTRSTGSQFPGRVHLCSVQSLQRTGASRRSAMPCQLSSHLSPSCGLRGHGCLGVACSFCASPPLVSRGLGLSASSLKWGPWDLAQEGSSRGMSRGRKEAAGAECLWWTRRPSGCLPCSEGHPKTWL